MGGWTGRSGTEKRREEERRGSAGEHGEAAPDQQRSILRGAIDGQTARKALSPCGYFFCPGTSSRELEESWRSRHRIAHVHSSLPTQASTLVFHA